MGSQSPGIGSLVETVIWTTDVEEEEEEEEGEEEEEEGDSSILKGDEDFRPNQC